MSLVVSAIDDRSSVIFAIALACALLSAVCLALGAERQGGAVRSGHEDEGLSASGMLGLLRNPRWLLGLGLMGAGTALNVVALSLAPITIVQPIGALALVMTTLLHARNTGITLSGTVRLAVLACLLGSAGFVLLGLQVRSEQQGIKDEQTLTVVILTGIAVVVLGVLSMLKKVRIPAFGYVVGAGILFGLVAVQVKVISSALILFPRHDLKDAGEWFLYQVPWPVVAGVAAASALGGWFVQKAYASGPPDLVIAGLTVIDPFVGVAVGISVLHELRPGFPPLYGVGMGLSALVAMVGVVTMARFHPDSAPKDRPVAA